MDFVDRFWDPPSYERRLVRVYGPDTFCLVLQQKIGFHLVSPSDELILRVPANLVRRRIVGQTLESLQDGQFPAFIKPVVPKQFRAQVHSSVSSVWKECTGLKPATAVLVSEPVKFTAEVRAFVLEGRVLDAAIYEGEASLAEAIEAVSALVRAMTLPQVFVVDVGFIESGGWAVVEFNAAWGAGLNGCSAEKVLPAVLAASAPPSV